MSEKKFRLVTRSDFDGLVCAVLLKELDLIDEILFVHPKDMQDGKIAITANDITTNLPYVQGCHLAFDHHLSETVWNSGDTENHIIDPKAPSAARVVYDHYGGRASFPNILTDMMDAVDKGDSAQFTEEEILEPSGWVLMNFIMDARTGLGRFRDFTISNYQLMMKLIDACKDHSIEEILAMEDVAERVNLYHEHNELAKAQISKCATVHNNLVVLDLTDQETIYATNRFVIYAMYPECNISIHKMWGLKKQNVVFAIGKSIVNRSANTNVGELCLNYGGGGHLNAGTCQVETSRSDDVLNELIKKINADG